MKVNKPYTKPAGSLKNKTGNWRSQKPIVDYSKCIGCQRCAKLCPDSCIIMKKIKNNPKAIIDYNYCKGCGLCAKECPVKAIKMVDDFK